MLSTFGPSDAAVFFQNKVVTLNNWKFAVFDCALDSLVVVLLVLCLSHVSFSQTQKAHTVLGSAPLLSQEFCHNQLDLQRLVARISIIQLVRTTFVNRLTSVRHQLVRTNFSILLLVRIHFVNLQLARMSSSILQLVRIHFVNLQLVRIDFVILQLVRIHFVNLQLVRIDFVNLQLARLDVVNPQLERVCFVNLLLVRICF